MKLLLANLIHLYVFMLLARAILSWFPAITNPTVRTLAALIYRATEPVLGTIRRVIPPLRLGGTQLDLSILILVYGLNFLASSILHSQL